MVLVILALALVAGLGGAIVTAALDFLEAAYRLNRN